MKRTIIGVLCLALLCAISAPAFALETTLSGFYKLRMIGDNFSAGNNFIGNLADNNKDEAVVDQRLRMKLNTKVNENLSFVYYAEIDMQFGDESYSNAGRNDGGGIGGDTTNLETKNLYIDVKVPDTNLAVRAGLQGLDDNYDYSFFGADMAGIKLDTKVGPAAVTAGWFNLGNGGNFQYSENINLWALQTNLTPSENLKFGVDYYYYQNQGNGRASETTYGFVDDDKDPTTAPIWQQLPTTYSQNYASFFGTADIGEVDSDSTSTNWSNTRQAMDLHYLGGHADFKLGSISLTGWVNTNIGSVDNLTINGTPMDVDVQGYAGSIKATTVLNGFSLAARGSFFSGDDDLSDGDADFIVNPLATESFAFGTDGFMIMTPDINWNSVGQFGFAMVDAAYAGYGLISGNVTASFKPSETTYVKGGIGYFASLEDSVKDDRTDRKGTTLGTEFFLRAGVKVAKNLDLSLNGAYATLGDFYDNNGGGQSANVVASDIDDPYEVYAQATLSF